jgi:hypothetical protein
VRRIAVAASLLLAVLGPIAATAPAHREESDKGCNVRLNVAVAFDLELDDLRR